MSKKKPPDKKGEPDKPSQIKNNSDAAKPLIDKLKVSAITIGVILVAGIATWISSGGGSTIILGWFRSPTIKATSLQRPSAEVFMAGEKIRFSLQDVKSERVFWIFDEKETLVGNVETDFEFPVDPTQPKGSTANHRIDVFFKDGGGYKAASIVVRIQNIPTEKANDQ